MRCRWFYLSCLGGLLGSASVSQAQDSTPLHTFFQRNYDSTIIYQSGLRQKDGPNYLILAKQANQVYFFSYSSPYREAAGRYFPGRLISFFANEEAAFRAAVPDTNRYLLPVAVLSDTLRRYWRLLNPRRFWAVKDDRQIPPPSSTHPCGIDDGDDNTFYLITPRSLKVASFYAPAYWEECLGKDPNRQQAISARRLFWALPRSGQRSVR
jgi:hypothetical protein